tara:strand:+ start:2039 stop:3067 length:1029 start_codon:yes stop_codon:yes gene_type:complete
MDLKIVGADGAPITDTPNIVSPSGQTLNPKVESNEVDQLAMGGTELMKYGLAERLDPELLNQFQIIPSRVREVDPDKKTVLWLHDLPTDPESQHLKEPENLEMFDKVVYVSEWQKQQYQNFLGIPPSKSVVLKNAIVPFEDHKKPEGVINIIYHTTPHRGLELLIPVYEQIAKMYDNVHLHVYSSFNAYGWPDRDKPYKELFDAIEAHPKMTYYGFQPNDVVREALKTSHIFAYPSIWQETSCIALMEAMSAGLMCVHSNLGALPETAANWTYQYQFDEDPSRHANAFGQCLIQAIELFNSESKKGVLEQRLQMQKVYANSFYSWDSRIIEWNGLLGSLAES